MNYLAAPGEGSSQVMPLTALSHTTTFYNQCMPILNSVLICKNQLISQGACTEADNTNSNLQTGPKLVTGTIS